MTTSTSLPQPNQCPIGHSPPLEAPEFAQIPIGPELTSDTHAARQQMRLNRPLVPVDLGDGVQATLVTGYRAALEILTNEDRYSADPTVWEQQMPADCPALLGLQRGPGTLRYSGSAHTRLRSAVVGSLGSVNRFSLQTTVKCLTTHLINGFCEAGQADLLNHFAVPLVRAVMCRVLGLSYESEQQAFDAVMILRSTSPGKIRRGRQKLLAVMASAVSAAESASGSNVGSRLLAHGLTAGEAAHQLASLYTFCEPTWNLIANAVLRVMTDASFAADVLAGVLTAQEAINKELYLAPPIAHTAARFPRQMWFLDSGGTVYEHQPVLISLAECNTDPAIANSGDRDLKGNRSHLAWGAGVHVCPAESIAVLVAVEAVDQILDVLPDIELAVPVEHLQWLPNLVHRGLLTLPTIFPPTAPLPLS